MSIERLNKQNARLAWLLNHQSIWEGFPQEKSEFLPVVFNPSGEKWLFKWRYLVEEMRKEGLIAKSTYWADVNIVGMINKARKLRRTQQG